MNGNEPGKNGGKKFDIRFIKGLIAITLGVILIVLSHKVILWMICFVGGLLLVYAGLVMLELSHAVNAVDSVIARIKKLLSL